MMNMDMAMVIYDFDALYGKYNEGDFAESEFERPRPCKGAIINIYGDYGLIPPGNRRPTPRRAAPKSQGQPGRTRLSSGAAHKAALYRERILNEV